MANYSYASAPVDPPPRLWRYDADGDDNFWFVSDDPATDNWLVTMTCALTGQVKTEAPVKTFVNIAGQQRRNAWPITPFTEYGYARIEVHPGDDESFLAVRGPRY